MSEMPNIKSEINLEKSIKSFYILKDIISFLSAKQKLNLIIYNKQLQRKFNVNIKDYKKISKVYKICEKNGKGKEYDKSTKNMIFEGEYLNKKRNGKGKEYYYGCKLKYEGEYLNGKRNGKGKEFNLMIN